MLALARWCIQNAVEHLSHLRRFEPSVDHLVDNRAEGFVAHAVNVLTYVPAEERPTGISWRHVSSSRLLL